MQRSWIANHYANVDWWSRITEGIFTAALLYLFWILFAQVLRPIELVYGAAGLLIFTLALMAIAMLFLQLSLVVQYSDYKRAWFGIAGGFFAWSVVEGNTRYGLPIPVPAGFVPMIMAALIVFLLWRSHLPVGARFFSLTFLMHWAGFLLLSFQARLASFSPVLSLLFHITGVLAVLLLIIVLCWVLFQTQRKIQRATGALILWFLGSVILYVFRGPIF
jgi:hypothetical protein